jgi:hypothetical protein|tara:strand:- start:7718 stop:7960 length:243 start_codon:yes stop_codon:yes gene_type:complete
MRRKKQKKESTLHLWGIRAPYKQGSNGLFNYNTFNCWEYLRECGNNRSALKGIDARKYSQLEIRNQDGKVVKTFTEEMNE